MLQAYKLSALFTTKDLRLLQCVFCPDITRFSLKNTCGSNDGNDAKKIQGEGE